MAKFMWVLLLILSVSIAATVLAASNKGASDIQIDGGSRGEVPFPHHAHQERLGDCNVCHAVFPQEPQSLNKLKAAGQLKPKEVMNKQCVKCHRAEKKAGNKSGPTTCSQCHIR